MARPKKLPSLDKLEKTVNIPKAATTVAKKVLRDQGRRRPRFTGWLAFLVVLLCISTIVWDQIANWERYHHHQESPNVQIPEEGLTGTAVALRDGTYLVKRVVDGDTLILDGEALGVAKDPRIRFLGVDTPETVKQNWPVEPFGPEASAYTKKRIAESGMVVRLEMDWDPMDKYGRFLAYVWVGDSLLNEELVRLGLGRVTHEFRFKRKEDFIRAEQAAKAEKRGIWSLQK